MEAGVNIQDPALLQGWIFFYSNHYTGTVSQSFLIKTGIYDTRLYGNIKTEDDGSMLLIEDVIVTDNGVEESLHNASRGNPNETTIKLYSNPTFTGGTVLCNGLISPKKVQGDCDLPPILMLKPNSNYIITVTLISANEFSVFLTFTERQIK